MVTAAHDATRMAYDAATLAQALEQMALAIAERLAGDDYYLVGLESRGVVIANRLSHLLTARGCAPLSVGTLDISLYRDDLDLSATLPKLRDSHIDFDLEGVRVILVDDVLYTGRTIRAAMEALMDYGRPTRIELAVLLDRGGRELPIQADYIGLHIAASPDEHVRVCLMDLETANGPEGVAIRRRVPQGQK